MGVVRKENSEASGRDGDPGLGLIGEQAEVFLGIEWRVNLPANRERTPADFVRSDDRVLNVDVPAVRFESGPFAAPSRAFIEHGVESFAVDLMLSRRHLREVGPPQVVAGP